MIFGLEKWIPGLTPDNAWIMQVFAVVLATALVSLVARRLLRKLGDRVHLTANRLDDIVFAAMSRPTGWIIWLQGLAIAADVILVETGSELFSYAESMRDIGVLVCITWFVLGIIRGSEDVYIKTAEQMDKTTALALGKLLRLVVIITAGLVILQTLGYSISGVFGDGRCGRYRRRLRRQGFVGQFFRRADCLS